MTKRNAITAQMKLDALLFRLANFEGFHIQGRALPLITDNTLRVAVAGIYLKCGICGEAIAVGSPIHWDHIHAISMGGPHTFRNLRPTHAACNQAKGVKEHRAKAKVDRLLGLTCNKPKAKIASPGFDKSKTRKFSGKVVPRAA